ncbi:MAG: hypothetical protein HZC54_00485 [Verrucomicrobia bacterium]|nr:hypothetical protein [Verrucomicrobiota bacterium]
MNLPDYQFISAPLWLVTVLHLLTLSLHFMAMNFLLGGVIITLLSNARKRWDDATAVKFARLFPAATAATVTLGVAPLLFLQLVYPRQVYAAAIVSGWFWLGVPAAVIVAYYALYRASFAGQRTGRAGKAVLLLALAGLLYVSLVYSSVFSMAEQPGLIRDLYARDQSGFVWNPAVGDYALRWLHMVFGALTVGGFFVGLLGRNDVEVFATGKRFFVGGMVAAALVGMAYLLALQEHLLALMRSPAIWALTASVLLSLVSLHFFFKKNFWLSGIMLFLSLAGMVFVRHTVRLLRLAGEFDLASWRVAPQWSPFAMFLACFVVMLVVVAWMLRMFFGAKKSAA